jgi:hypothetical protein
VYEFIPLAAGVIAALLVQSLPTGKVRLVALILLSAVSGAVATFISGEILVSPAYLIFDVAQALLAAGVTTLLVAWLRRWRTPPLR